MRCYLNRRDCLIITKSYYFSNHFHLLYLNNKDTISRER